MATEAASQAVWSVTLPTPDDTDRFAARIADFLRAGDLVTLSGDLGVGKTTFARGLVRHMAEDAELEVPSPTFTLMQLYRTPTFPIVHADLYRIRSAAELAELGWDEAAEGALLLVEWAERIGDNLPEDRLDVTLAIDPDPSRNRAHGRGDGIWSFRRPDRPDPGGRVASGRLRFQPMPNGCS